MFSTSVAYRCASSSPQEFGFVHLSAGELLRNARNSNSADGQLISDYIKEGLIVPVEITIKLLQEVSNNHIYK